jgi:hypothetical protein
VPHFWPILPEVGVLERGPLSREVDVNPEKRSQPDGVSMLLISLVLILAGVPSVLCCIFFFGKFYGASIAAFYLVFLPLVARFLRKRQRSQIEKLPQTPKSTDDPRQMARWVP